MGLRPTYCDENSLESVEVRSRERKFCFARSAASTPGGSDEDGGDRRTQESINGGGDRNDQSRREAGAAAIYHLAGRPESIVQLAASARCARSGHGIHCAILADGVVGIGATYALAFGPCLLQPCTTWTQT